MFTHNYNKEVKDKLVLVNRKIYLKKDLMLNLKKIHLIGSLKNLLLLLIIIIIVRNP